MDKLEYKARLNNAYGGAVTPVTRYINEHATICFHCDKCGAEFYNRAGYMIGKDSQRHVCTLPYGDRNGDRTYGRNTRSNKRKGKSSVATGKQFYSMVINDYTPNEIAKELSIPHWMVMDYFEAEGLI
ncbi:adenylate kinase [Bacillus cereus VDM062]|nr:adenylate kinase [Bacillus cereus VDM062]